jgi:hypothetical protein
MKSKRILVVIFTIFSLISLKQSCIAQDRKDTLNILFVGNSYTYFENLPQIISIISEGTKVKLVTKKSTAGGAKLSQHWRSDIGLKTKETIRNGNFDIVVLQEQSMGTILEPDSVLKYTKLFCDYIKKFGSKPYLYLTWAREKVPQYQEIINKVQLQAATENDVKIVPVGKAWALAKQLRPDIELYVIDGSHPTNIGTFLTACVFVSTIVNELPTKLKSEYTINDLNGESVQLMYIDPDDAIFCRLVAEQITKKQ